MFCRKCGHELTDEAEFCTKCGEQVILDNAQLAQTKNNPKDISGKTFKPRNNKNRREQGQGNVRKKTVALPIITAALVVTGMLLLFFMCYYYKFAPDYSQVGYDLLLDRTALENKLTGKKLESDDLYKCLSMTSESNGRLTLDNNIYAVKKGETIVINPVSHTKPVSWSVLNDCIGMEWVRNYPIFIRGNEKGYSLVKFAADPEMKTDIFYILVFCYD